MGQGGQKGSNMLFSHTGHTNDRKTARRQHADDVDRVDPYLTSTRARNWSTSALFNSTASDASDTPPD